MKWILVLLSFAFCLQAAELDTFDLSLEDLQPNEIRIGLSDAVKSMIKHNASVDLRMKKIVGPTCILTGMAFGCGAFANYTRNGRWNLENFAATFFSASFTIIGTVTILKLNF